MTSATRMPGPGCMGSPPTWSASIAGTRHRQYRIRQAAAAEPEVPGHAERVAADVTAQAMRPLLDAALAALPAGDRDVLLLIAWEQLTYQEVSRALAHPGGDGAVQAAPGAHEGAPGPDRYRCGGNV